MASTAKGKKGPAIAKSASESFNGSAADLLTYYKQRIGTLLALLRSSVPDVKWRSHLAHTYASADEFEAERQNLLDKVDVCAAQKSEQHKLEWESKRRSEEVKELQKVSHTDHCRQLRHVESLLGASSLRSSGLLLAEVPCIMCVHVAPKHPLISCRL